MKNNPSLKEEIDNIIGEDGYNLGAYQFEDNKMRFAYTVDQLVQMRKKTLSAFTQAIERADPKYVWRVKKQAVKHYKQRLLAEVK